MFKTGCDGRALHIPTLTLQVLHTGRLCRHHWRTRAISPSSWYQGLWAGTLDLRITTLGKNAFGSWTMMRCWQCCVRSERGSVLPHSKLLRCLLAQAHNLCFLSQVRNCSLCRSAVSVDACLRGAQHKLFLEERVYWWLFRCCAYQRGTGLLMSFGMRG